VETSICGQAGSKREMVKFLVERGIDSISVNADVAADIAEYISELEGNNNTEVKEENEKPQKEKPLPPNMTEKVDVKEEEKVEEKSVNNENDLNNSSPSKAEAGASDSDVGQTEMNNRANVESGVEMEKDNGEGIMAESVEEETLVEEDPAKKPIEEEGKDKNLESPEEKDEESREKESSGGINLENERSPSEASAPNIPGSEFALQENLEGDEKEEVLDIF